MDTETVSDQQLVDDAYTNMSRHLDVLLETARGIDAPNPELVWLEMSLAIKNQVCPTRLAPYLAAALVRLK